MDTTTAPREREIEIIARLARGALIALRVLALLIGIGAIAGAAWQAWQWETLMSENAPAPPIAERIAHSMVFVCFGLSLLVPVRWLSRARVLPLLVAGAVLWFAPCLLPGDHPYGFLLRMFATSVGIVALLLWRTLFDLTRPAAASVST